MRTAIKVISCKIWFSAFLLSVLVFYTSLFPQDQTALDEFIHQTMTQHHLPGVAACAVKNGEVIWMDTFGFANIQQNVEVTENTIFMLASISKNVTGVAFMQLYEKGLIGLDDDINSYLPFQVRHPLYPNVAITPRMLLSHVSGIRDNWDKLGPLESHGSDSPIHLSDFTRGYLVPGGRYYNINNFNNSEPCTMYDYTNVGSTLIAYLVEVISQITFEQYCQENIFEPLGMNESSWFLANLNISHIAIPYRYSNSRYIAIQHYGSPVYPCGFLKTSVSQFSRYLIAVMQKGQIDSTRILNETTIDTMMTLHYPIISPNYGFFFQNFENFWGHGGGAPGVATRMFFNPTMGIGVIVLLNIENPTAVDLISQEIYQFAENYVSSVEYKENKNHFPSNFTLYQNYPNPFNSSTTIRYHISRPENVRLQIFDTIGRLVLTLIDNQQEAGDYQISWDGTDRDGLKLGTGIYLCQLSAERYTLTKKLILIK